MSSKKIRSEGFVEETGRFILQPAENTRRGPYTQVNDSNANQNRPEKKTEEKRIGQRKYTPYRPIAFFADLNTPRDGDKKSEEITNSISSFEEWRQSTLLAASNSSDKNFSRGGDRGGNRSDKRSFDIKASIMQNAVNFSEPNPSRRENLGNRPDKKNFIEGNYALAPNQMRYAPPKPFAYFTDINAPRGDYDEKDSDKSDEKSTEEDDFFVSRQQTSHNSTSLADINSPRIANRENTFLPVTKAGEIINYEANDPTPNQTSSNANNNEQFVASNDDNNELTVDGCSQQVSHEKTQESSNEKGSCLNSNEKPKFIVSNRKLPAVREHKTNSATQLKEPYRRNCHQDKNRNTDDTVRDQIPPKPEPQPIHVHDRVPPEPESQSAQETKTCAPVIKISNTQTQTAANDANILQECGEPITTQTQSPHTFQQKDGHFEIKNLVEIPHVNLRREVKPKHTNSIFSAACKMVLAILILIIVSWLFSQWFDLDGLLDLFVVMVHLLQETIDKIRQIIIKSIPGYSIMCPMWRQIKQSIGIS